MERSNQEPENKNDLIDEKQLGWWGHSKTLDYDRRVKKV